MHIKYIAFIIISIYSNMSWGQKKRLLIKDKTTNEVINLVAVYNQKGNGTYSDENGFVDISLSNNDTIFISHLSYQRRLVLPN